MGAKLLFFAGSARKDSLNKKLAKLAYKIALEQGASATFIDLKDFPMPIYDGDLEAESSLPAKAIELKKIFAEHQGLFISSPEYNSSISPLLKNTLDWISRPHEANEPSLTALRGKVVALAAASPGGFGGLRGLVPLRMMLGNILIQVLPEQLAVSQAHEAFHENGDLVNEKQNESLKNIVIRLIEVSEKLAG